MAVNAASDVGAPLKGCTCFGSLGSLGGWILPDLIFLAILAQRGD